MAHARAAATWRGARARARRAARISTLSAADARAALRLHARARARADARCAPYIGSYHRAFSSPAAIIFVFAHLLLLRPLDSFNNTHHGTQHAINARTTLCLSLTSSLTRSLSHLAARASPRAHTFLCSHACFVAEAGQWMTRAWRSMFSSPSSPSLRAVLRSARAHLVQQHAFAARRATSPPERFHGTRIDISFCACLRACVIISTSLGGFLDVLRARGAGILLTQQIYSFALRARSAFARFVVPLPHFLQTRAHASVAFSRATNHPLLNIFSRLRRCAPIAHRAALEKGLGSISPNSLLLSFVVYPLPPRKNFTLSLRS